MNSSRILLCFLFSTLFVIAIIVMRLKFLIVFDPGGLVMVVSVFIIWKSRRKAREMLQSSSVKKSCAELFSCLVKISYIEWALDSVYIPCGLYKKSIIQAWSLTQPEWTCKIDEGPAGITCARWSPDSHHIFTTSDFQLQLTVWSLVNIACVHVQWPKHASKGVSFTRDGKIATICTRRDYKDYINLLSCHTWEIMGILVVDSLDLANIERSPNDSVIVIRDLALEYKVLIYFLDGRCLLKYQAYDSGLGVKSISWSPCGQFLAVGSYDQMLWVLNHLTWKTFAELMHPSTVRGPCYVAVFKEVDEPLQLDMSELCLSNDFSQGNNEGPFRVRQGIGLVSCSNDNQYICTCNDSMPTILWIWDIRHLELAAILAQKDPIKAAAWDPTSTRLALCTEAHICICGPLLVLIVFMFKKLEVLF